MVERFKTDIHTGLNNKQVTARMQDDLQHRDCTIKTKTLKDILYSNVFTLFNILNLTLGLLVFYTGSYKNLLFLGVVVCNTIISLYHEIHAKRIIDKLAIISSTKAKLVREGREALYNMEEIVLDDVIKYTMGNQIIVDSIIKEGTVEVDESFITGESNAVIKVVGDMLLSGSFIVSGNCTAVVEHIADDNYVNKISAYAKYIKKPNSEIMNTMRKIIKAISIIIIPLGLLLFWQQMNLDGNTVNNSILNTVAAIIGMIPEGLVLLTSTVLAVGAIRLAKNQVLIQELYCIETLARVDTICLDKTGTITTGKMSVVKTVPLDRSYKIDEILTAIAHYNSDNNATASALRDTFVGETKYELKETIPFSSKRKYSGMHFKDRGKFLVGAPEYLSNDSEVLEKVKEHSDYRVLLLAHEVNGKNKAIALILIQDVIRHNASETIAYFYEQGVDIKVISGDSIQTIQKIATTVGMRGIQSIDMSVPNKETMKDIVGKYNVFGRVSPNQKKSLILALKEIGHTVAMTGDGVNDVLALKEADCSIALSCGSDAAKCVSGFVLLDSDFASIPKIVNEGRRSINNLQRSATLFLTKTMYSTLLAILFLFVNMNYPFEPIQLSLNSIVAIGIPAFILALEPNNDRVTGNFIINVIQRSIPAAFTIVLNIVGVMIFSSVFHLDTEYSSTMALFLLAFTGFQLLYKICYPFNYVRGILFGGLVGIFFGGSIGLRALFDLVVLTPHMFLFVCMLFLLDILLFNVMTHVCEKKIFKYKERIIR